MWVLMTLIVLSNSEGVAASEHSQEFSSAKNCMNAKKVLDSTGRYYLAVCVPK